MGRFWVWGTLSICIISLLILAACSSGSGSSSGGGGGNSGTLSRANISGSVKFGGVGVAGASVSLTDMKGFAYWTGTTDANGNFSGTTGPDQNISSTFTATKAGFQTYNQSVTVSPGGSYTFSATI